MALVEHYARMGRRLQWNVGMPTPQRVIGRNNRIALVGESKGEGRYTYGSYCPLQYTAPTVEQLIVRRFEYLVWRDGLKRLTGILRGWLLRAHVPGEVDAPATPWLDAAPMPRSAPMRIDVPAWPVMDAGRVRDAAAREAERKQRRARKIVPTI